MEDKLEEESILEKKFSTSMNLNTHLHFYKWYKQWLQSQSKPSTADFHRTHASFELADFGEGYLPIFPATSPVV